MKMRPASLVGRTMSQTNESIQYVNLLVRYAESCVPEQKRPVKSW
jgi:hypothetical protein